MGFIGCLQLSDSLFRLVYTHRYQYFSLLLGLNKEPFSCVAPVSIKTTATMSGLALIGSFHVSCFFCQKLTFGANECQIQKSDTIVRKLHC